MPYQKREIEIGSICHVLNRGVDKRKIFMQEKDYVRFIHDLFEFNDERPANGLSMNYYFKKESLVLRSPEIEVKTRKILVDILAFCLMPNHYHLMLRERTAGGIVRFMKKLNMGYARYFNEKYKRSGALFQGRYKSVVVTNQTHFTFLPYYIHLNPLDLVTPEWRERSLKSFRKAWSFLNNYRWSSHLDYAGQKNFPSITQRGFLTGFFDGPGQYQKGIREWLESLELNNIKEILLE